MSYSQLFYAGTDGQMKSGKTFRVETEPTLQYIGLYGTSIAENYWALRSTTEDGASCLHSFAGNPENFVREINDDESPRHWPMYEVYVWRVA